MVKRITVTVIDPVGLYATPATELVDNMKVFKSDIKLVYASKTVNMKSLMGVLSLGIPTKAQIEIIADGEDADAAIDHAMKKMKELGICD
ncbi:HPr family phosphocarrier protein [Thomasclavelia sp.]|uniref:HPr family phosphocarrier protein n=1 Tax=Thomasclavelia sp. TaxID=3025757 RepID=UPI0025FA3A40|nr:HPr family phosphocarrier protein [Thomasclavelia sp.]